MNATLGSLSNFCNKRGISEGQFFKKNDPTFGMMPVQTEGMKETLNSSPSCLLTDTIHHIFYDADNENMGDVTISSKFDMFMNQFRPILVSIRNIFSKSFKALKMQAVWKNSKINWLETQLISQMQREMVFLLRCGHLPLKNLVWT